MPFGDVPTQTQLATAPPTPNGLLFVPPVVFADFVSASLSHVSGHKKPKRPGRLLPFLWPGPQLKPEQLPALTRHHIGEAGSKFFKSFFGALVSQLFGKTVSAVEMEIN